MLLTILVVSLVVIAATYWLLDDLTGIGYTAMRALTFTLLVCLAGALALVGSYELEKQDVLIKRLQSQAKKDGISIRNANGSRKNAQYASRAIAGKYEYLIYTTSSKAAMIDTLVSWKKPKDAR